MLVNDLEQGHGHAEVDTGVDVRRGLLPGREGCLDVFLGEERARSVEEGWRERLDQLLGDGLNHLRVGD